jgi:phosphatidylserine decarboxylase
VTPTKNKNVSIHDYPDVDIHLAKGDEMGRFNMGSTVILLAPTGALKTLAGLGAGDAVQVGEKLGKI